MRVVASYLHVHAHIAIATARAIDATEKNAGGVAESDTEQLVARLERISSCAVADLAKHAQRWA